MCLPILKFYYSGFSQEVRERFKNEFPHAPVKTIIQDLILENKKNTAHGKTILTNNFRKIK